MLGVACSFQGKYSREQTIHHLFLESSRTVVSEDITKVMKHALGVFAHCTREGIDVVRRTSRSCSFELYFPYKAYVHLE